MGGWGDGGSGEYEGCGRLHGRDGSGGCGGGRDGYRHSISECGVGSRFGFIRSTKNGQNPAPCALILASFGAFGAQLVAFSPGFPGSPTIPAAETIVLIAGTWQAGDAESQ